MLQSDNMADVVRKATPKSILQVVQRAAQDGLLLDGKEAAIVAFGDKATYMPMVQGILKKARNSGQISKIDAIPVYENDEFSFDPGSDDVPKLKADWFGNRGQLKGVYAVARLNDGQQVVEIMDSDQIMAIASQSKNKAAYSGPHAGEWWRKTVLRRICKYLPSSTDLDSFFGDADEEFEAPAAVIINEPEKSAPAASTKAAMRQRKAEAEQAEIVDTGSGEIHHEEIPHANMADDAFAGDDDCPI